MKNNILENKKRVQDNILKSFGTSDEEELEKARQIGDIHPNGKWVWGESASGKRDWKAIKGGTKKADSSNTPPPAKPSSTPSSTYDGTTEPIHPVKGSIKDSEVGREYKELKANLPIFEESLIKHKEKIDKMDPKNPLYEKETAHYEKMKAKLTGFKQYESDLSARRKFLIDEIDSGDYGKKDDKAEIDDAKIKSKAVYNYDGSIKVLETLQGIFPKLLKMNERASSVLTSASAEDYGVDLEEVKKVKSSIDEINNKFKNAKK